MRENQYKWYFQVWLSTVTEFINRYCRYILLKLYFCFDVFFLFLPFPRYFLLFCSCFFFVFVSVLTFFRSFSFFIFYISSVFFFFFFQSLFFKAVTLSSTKIKLFFSEFNFPSNLFHSIMVVEDRSLRKNDDESFKLLLQSKLGGMRSKREDWLYFSCWSNMVLVW